MTVGSRERGVSAKCWETQGLMACGAVTSTLAEAERPWLVPRTAWVQVLALHSQAQQYESWLCDSKVLASLFPSEKWARIITVTSEGVVNT